MAPIPSNNTAVLFVDYQTCGEDHTVQCRFDAPSTVDDAMAAVAAVWGAMDSLLYLCTVTGARVRANGSNITLPVAWPEAATFGSGAGPHQASAYYVDFIGRSPGGRRVRMGFFGAQANADAIAEDFRLSSTDSGVVGDAVDILNSADGTCLAVDGLQPIWYPYADIGTNAYWRNRIR